MQSLSPFSLKSFLTSSAKPVLIFLIVITSKNAAYGNNITAIKLVQQSKVTGVENVYASKTGLRVENARANSVIVSKAPSWQVFKCDLNSKRYICVDYKFYQNRLGRSQALLGGTTLKDATVKPLKPSTWNNFDVEIFSADEAFKRRAVQLYRKNREVTGDFPVTFTYTTLPTTKFPTQIAHILCLLHDLPTVEGLPLMLLCEPFNQKKYFYLNTATASLVTLPERSFNLPSGLAKVENEGALTTDDSALRDFMDFIH